ncbi:MAG: hypothetical protein ACYTFW_20735 [Planctomycetota bacterium]|jgi:hypothetical protein
MTRQRLLFGSFLLLAALTVAISVQAEILVPGTYHGYFTVTRWGQKVFHLGPYHLFVSDSAAQVLEKHRGKPLELKISKLSQPINPGAGLIEGIAKVTEKGVARGLILSVQLKTKKVLQGQGILLHLSLCNDSEEAITILPGTLAIVLVTDSPFSNKDIGYKDPDNRAYWYYSYRYHSFEKGKRPLHIACRRIILPWTGENLVSLGHNIPVADKDLGFCGPIVIEPKGRFKAKYVAGKELLPDDYEVFFYLTSGNLSSVPGPMSDRLSFDVVEQKQEAKTAEPSALADKQ